MVRGGCCQVGLCCAKNTRGLKVVGMLADLSSRYAERYWKHKIHEGTSYCEILCCSKLQIKDRINIKACKAPQQGRRATAG